MNPVIVKDRLPRAVDARIRLLVENQSVFKDLVVNHPDILRKQKGETALCYKKKSTRL